MIRAQDLTYDYRTRTGPVTAVNGVSFEVEPGETVGFLGPNGAGKSSTVRILTTLATPRTGTASVAGFDVVRQRREVRKHIGYVAQSSSVGEHYVGDELRTQAQLQGLTARAAARRAGELAEMFDLTDMMGRAGRKLSGGQQRRFDLALGLVHHPEVLFLDEPTSGLDPVSRAGLWKLLRRLRTESRLTIFLTTHYLEEADQLCDRILVMDAGTIVAANTADALKEQFGADVVMLTTHQVDDAATVVAEAFPDCAIDTLDGQLRFQTRSAQRRLPDLLRALDYAGIHLLEVSVTRPTLDDVFLRLTARGADPGTEGSADAEATAVAASRSDLIEVAS